jgi:hypothetical protein
MQCTIEPRRNKFAGRGRHVLRDASYRRASATHAPHATTPQKLAIPKRSASPQHRRVPVLSQQTHPLLLQGYVATHGTTPATRRVSYDALKDVPTMEEIGFKGFDALQWYGSVGPAGMPADVVKRLNETQVAVLKAPDLAEKLAGEAVEPWPMSPEQFGQYMRSEVSRWTALAKPRNIQLDE